MTRKIDKKHGEACNTAEINQSVYKNISHKKQPRVILDMQNSRPIEIVWIRKVTRRERRGETGNVEFQVNGTVYECRLRGVSYGIDERPEKSVKLKSKREKS